MKQDLKKDIEDLIAAGVADDLSSEEIAGNVLSAIEVEAVLARSHAQDESASVIVPREPTDEMSLAGRKACAAVADRMEQAKQTAVSVIDFWQQVGRKPADEIYRAMIAAAPRTPAEGEEAAYDRSKTAPVAWIAFADNGNVRFWTADQQRAKDEKARGLDMRAFTLAELMALVSRLGHAEAQVENAATWQPIETAPCAATKWRRRMSELDEALRILKEVRAAIIGCCDPSGSDEDGYRIRHGELTGWFDQLETAGLHILRASLATRRSDALQTLADIDRDLIDDRKSAKQPAILAREITAVDEFLADGQEDNGYRAFAMMRHMWPRLKELALSNLDKSPGSAPGYDLPGHDKTMADLDALTIRGAR